MTIDRPMLRYGVFLFLGATTVLLFSQSASAQWTQPSGSSNVYKTDTNGNVGIGTITPNDKLNVAGNIRLESGNAVVMRTADTTSGSQNAMLSATALTFYNTGSGASAPKGAIFFNINRSASGITPGLFAGIYGGTENTTDDDAAGVLTFSTTVAGSYNVLNERMRITSAGAVGIGTTSPSGLLHLQSASHTYLRIGAPLGYQSSIAFNDDSNGQDIVLYRPQNTRDFSIWTATAGNAVNVSQGGNIGIGTAPTAYKLDVNGNTNVTGNLNVTGTVNAKYQDVAEWVPSSEKLAAGTVVVLDSTKSNQVVASTTAYDTRVAGVVSSQPGLTLGEKSDGKVLVATTGRVLVKVDASRGPINIGDLLVTSDVPGVAMKSEPIEIGGRKMHMPGTLIGKALEPLEKGKGEILVLLSLQ